MGARRTLQKKKKITRVFGRRPRLSPPKRATIDDRFCCRLSTLAPVFRFIIILLVRVDLLLSRFSEFFVLAGDDAINYIPYPRSPALESSLAPWVSALASFLRMLVPRCPSDIRYTSFLADGQITSP